MNKALQYFCANSRPPANNLLLNGLGLPRSGGNVVTDALHFEGALIHLLALRREGLDVRLVLPRDWRIELRDLERGVDRKTKLNRGK